MAEAGLLPRTHPHTKSSSKSKASPSTSATSHLHQPVSLSREGQVVPGSDAVALKPGQTILFQGTGGVSINSLVLAKAAGARTIVTSSDSKLEYVKSKYGVDHIINYKRTPDWAAEANRLTSGLGVDYILENGGSGTIKQSLSAIAYGGVISVIGFLSSATQKKMPDVAGLALSTGAVVRGIMIRSKQMLKNVVRFIGVRELDVPVEKSFRFERDEVVKAFDYWLVGACWEGLH
ncbi:hypothetical protein ASPWEDRAFT_166260 [Aspergillus wentii DTO 134E9]|uniref:Enoyl reductase (ER) domain-containing protein n=1 Tax=Aspergillus wentii DTO 134E9 TaxID=1073089 RepID=A0A1L9RZ79_ASPWE|nr:uncharacterized protein ASPWEDRAFT_166260 [Aspergillus wentii DTO 134E9]KAI9932606.1 hypothetical protein MW887_008851 [Aspergillus wentii]OJJ40174.1 hypothetical protein ASPWEDRAFT_166260 [Aspergillus wentii DTO 134E9]